MRVATRSGVVSAGGTVVVWALAELGSAHRGQATAIARILTNGFIGLFPPLLVLAKITQVEIT